MSNTISTPAAFTPATDAEREFVAMLLRIPESERADVLDMLKAATPDGTDA